jgi:hypothetical protein
MFNPPKHMPIERFFTGGYRPATKNSGTKITISARKKRRRNGLRPRSRRKGGRSK